MTLIDCETLRKQVDWVASNGRRALKTASRMLGNGWGGSMPTWALVPLFWSLNWHNCRTCVVVRRWGNHMHLKLPLVPTRERSKPRRMRAVDSCRAANRRRWLSLPGKDCLKQFKTEEANVKLAEDGANLAESIRDSARNCSNFGAV